MVELKAILHPTDFSERSRAALKLARALARDHGARLLILHVTPYVYIPYGVPVPSIEIEEAREQLMLLRAETDGPDLKYPIEPLIAEGNEVDEILRVASERQVDLIVLGTHGRTGLSRVLMGSVAEAVLREATCPVMTIKIPALTGEARSRPAAVTVAQSTATNP